VRAGLPGYMDPGRDDLTMQLAYLPDFRTESKEPVRLPKFLKNKPGTRAVDLPNTTVRGYLIAWLTDWVRTYGIDGFRCDTVKHVEPEAWAELKQASVQALAAWKAEHAQQKIDDAPFWMVGELWGHGPARGPLHDHGFDAMINFEFQHRAASAVAGGMTEVDQLFTEYAAMQHGKLAQMLNYLSSHDTELFDRKRLVAAGSVLLLAPGAVQIFYGDEVARPPGIMPATDPQQATRSDMPWDHVDAIVLSHWRTLGSFRARHVAVARGAHARLSDKPYVFSRVDGADKVVIGLEVPAGAVLPVAPVFAEGETLADPYNGTTHVVHHGAVTIDRAARAVLLESVR
jgi:alpha-amylase